MSSRMIKKHTRSERRKGAKHDLQLALRYQSRCDRLWYLCQTYSCNGSTYQCRKIVRNIGTINDDLDLTAIIVECPRRDCAS